METSSPSAAEPIQLTCDEVVADRPFTAVEMTQRDLTHVRVLITDLTEVLTDTQDTLKHRAPFESTTWQVDRLTHRVLICNEELLLAHPELCLVGFFGNRRAEVDVTPLEKANAEIVAEFAKYPGILSYSSVELADGNWINLVLHDDPVDTEYWRKSELHARAVDRFSADHYQSVRIHNGHLTGCLGDRPDATIHRTKYFDYSGEREWRAVRDF